MCLVCVCVCVCKCMYVCSQAGQLEYDEVVDFTRARSSLSAAFINSNTRRPFGIYIGWAAYALVSLLFHILEMKIHARSIPVASWQVAIANV